MDFSYSPKEEAFRKEIKDWLAENMKELPRWWFRPQCPGARPGFAGDAPVQPVVAQETL